MSKSKSPWRQNHYDLPVSEIWESLHNRGIFIRVVSNQKIGERLTEITDNEIVRFVEEFRLQLSRTSESHQEYDQIKEIAQVLQTEASRRGYTFVCRCGKKGLHRVEKEVFCHECLAKAQNGGKPTSRRRAS